MKRTKTENLDSIQKPEYLEDFDPDLRKAFENAGSSAEEYVDYSKVKMHKDKIKLSGDGMFYTLQGEGPTIGLPCVFVRLHVCNLKCEWCDAWYTWDPRTKEYWTEPRDVSFEELITQLEQTWKGSDLNPRIVWTGGEPLIQKKQIDEVIKILWTDEHNHWEHEFETNGTLMPTELQLAFAQFNCSPKLSNSQNNHHSMVRPKILEALNKANTTFKFVCKDENDLKEIEEKYCPHIFEDKIIIMPEGIVENEITPHARALYEPVLQRGWRMTPRFQAIFADGARRGV